MVKNLNLQTQNCRKRSPNAPFSSKASKLSATSTSSVSSIPTIEKKRLRKIDSGRCLISQVLNSILVRACHILHRNTANTLLKSYERAWHAKDLNLNSISNLVSLRDDWRASYDSGCWALVPAIDVLRKIVVADKGGTFRRPFKGYDPHGAVNYVLVTLPTFKPDSFIRFRHDCQNFDVYDAHDHFAGFPVIQSHVHPYFAIVNALPKLEAHRSALTSEQWILYVVMRSIVDEWGATSDALHPDTPKRPRGDEGDAGMGDSSGGRPKRKKSCHHINADRKGPKSKLSQENRNQHLLRPSAQESYPSPPQSATMTDHDLFHDSANILAWIDTVRTAQPLSRVPEDVIKSDGEQACPPFEGDWHDWCGCPYVQPSDTSLFCSVHWASYLYNCMLTMPPGCWDSPACWEDSDDEDEHGSNRLVCSKCDDYDGATSDS